MLKNEQKDKVDFITTIINKYCQIIVVWYNFSLSMERL